MVYHVGSEVGSLRQVIVHRPDLEMKRLTPSNCRDFLFDDVLWVKRARQEHDAFTDTLRELGVVVHHFHGLLLETVRDPRARAYILDRVFDERVFGPMAVDALRNAFDAMDEELLTTLLIGGVTKREMLERIEEPKSVAFRALDSDALLLPPLPNHMFTRDTSAWIYGGVSVNSMRKKARMRETLHYEAIYRWHPMFADGGFEHWSEGSGAASRRPRAATCSCSAGARSWSG